MVEELRGARLTCRLRGQGIEVSGCRLRSRQSLARYAAMPGTKTHPGEGGGVEQVVADLRAL